MTSGIGALLTTYTFRTMVLGTCLVGAVAGLLGCFLFLQRRSMVSDVIGHSSVAGVAVAFLVASGVFGVDGRMMPVLVVGALGASLAAVLLTGWVSSTTPLGADAAMAASLAIFFGGGMVLLRWITHSSLPGRGGIESSVFGNAATMLTQDLWTIGAVAVGVVAFVVACRKELALLLFDPVAAHVLGFRPRLLGGVLLVVLTTGLVLGIKAVGVILIVGFATLPAATARLWVRRLPAMLVASALLGAGGAVVGSATAVQLGKVPTGPVIVVVLFLGFAVSLMVAPRGILRRGRARRRVGVAA